MMMIMSFTTTTLSLNLREILTVLPNPKITTHETSGGCS